MTEAVVKSTHAAEAQASNILCFAISDGLNPKGMLNINPKSGA